MQLYGVALQHLLSTGICRTLLVGGVVVTPLSTLDREQIEQHPDELAGGVITSNRLPEHLGLNVPVEGDMTAFVLTLAVNGTCCRSSDF